MDMPCNDELSSPAQKLAVTDAPQALVQPFIRKCHTVWRGNQTNIYAALCPTDRSVWQNVMISAAAMIVTKLGHSLGVECSDCIVYVYVYVFVGAGFPMHCDLIWSIVRPL
jgi:hypothetical protein